MTSFAAAPALPDLLKPRRQRKGWTGFLLNNPTITFGAGLLPALPSSSSGAMPQAAIKLYRLAYVRAEP